MVPIRPHPCVSESFGKRAVTVSLVTGDVYTDDVGEVSEQDATLAALWVWCVLNEHGFETEYTQAAFAAGG